MLILILIFGYICFAISVIYSPFQKLEEQEYKLIESYVNFEFVADSEEDIRLVVDFFNTSKFHKTLKWVDTLASPDVAITFEKKDGSKEKLEIYGGAWTSGAYLIFEGVQYKVRNIDEFYMELDKVAEQVKNR